MKLNEEKKLIVEINRVIKKKISDSARLEQCENVLLLLDEWFHKDNPRTVINVYKKNDMQSVRFAIDECIPVMEYVIQHADAEYIGDYYDIYKRLYAFCGRRDLECFIDYMEWNKAKKVLSTRRSALKPFIYGLNRLAFDPQLEIIIVSYPPSYGKCIDENTPILTPNGYKPIKDINVGDEVCSMKDKEMVVEKVLHKWNTMKKQAKITTRSGKTITISPDHHMLTQDGYKCAKILSLNDNFIACMKDIYEYDPIEAIEYIDEEIPMVDIEVSNTHNFIANGFVSHNSFCLNYYTAWRLGMNPNGSSIRLSYSLDLVSGFSRAVKDIISTDEFADVFEVFQKYKNDIFGKEKETDWKISFSENLKSHIARTREGSTTGERASLDIMLDDMIKGETEATDDNLHTRIYNKWQTEWSNRDDGMTDGKLNTKFVIAGTMWSPDDLLNRVRDDYEKVSPIKPVEDAKWVWETEDKTALFIRVPALDENDESTCPNVKTTEKYRRLRDNLDPYYFSCVYQQDPIPPTGLEFASDLLRKYESTPKGENGEDLCDKYVFAVLDPARKGKDYVSMPICKRKDDNYYLVDVLYQRKPMTELYDDIVNRIIEHKITTFVVENNTDTSLKVLLDKLLAEKGYNNCDIREKYNVENKEKRIKDARGLIKKNIVFKADYKYTKNSEYGQFMQWLNKYSFDYHNAHDDAPDSLALFTNEIILEKSLVPTAKAVSRSGL